MRIIAGTWKGRRLEAPEGRTTRPMLDRVREALFSVLGRRVEGAAVWDLFAGTGCLGLEALSRGARRAWFVERDRRALAVLKANLERCQGPGAEGPGTLLAGDAWRPDLCGTADLVFLDPPYAQVRGAGDLLRERLAALRARLAPGGVLVFHYEAGGTDPAAGLAREVRLWGRSAVAFLAAGEGPGSPQEERRDHE